METFGTQKFTNRTPTLEALRQEDTSSVEAESVAVEHDEQVHDTSHELASRALNGGPEHLRQIQEDVARGQAPRRYS